MCEGGVVKRKKKEKVFGARKEEEEEQLCGVDPKEIIRNYTHTTHTHQVGKKKRRQVGRSCIPPPPPLKLGSIVFGRLELLPLQSRCDRLPSRFIIIPVQFGVARVLT